jgi:arsenate reductase-like glutaredoxin family protein
MSIIFYGYKRCKTSREVERALTSQGLSLNFIDIVKNPPDKKVLKELVEKYGVEGVVRVGKSEARKALEKEGLERFLEKLRLEPKRLIRPVVIAGDEVYAGRDALKIVGHPRERRVAH